MDWLPWTLIALVMFGSWGVVARGIIDRLDWRWLATVSLVGYALPVGLMWLIASPATDQLTWAAAGKAVSVGLLTQLALFMFYNALYSGGKAAVVVPIAALFPAVTLGGALIFLGESLSVVQFFGAGLALIAGWTLARG